MSTELVVPDLGESIVEATVAEWLKKEGDRVEAGEAVVVLETEKVDLDVGAARAGVLGKILRQQGEDVKVGDVLAVIEEAAASAETQPAPAVQRQESAAEQVAPPPAAAATREPAADRATPVARRMAEEHALKLAEVAPSGPRGRVTKEDVERHLRGDGQPPSLPVLPPADVISRREERVRMSRRRRTIAERLVAAQHTAAMLTTFNEIDMTTVMALRQRRQDAFVAQYGVKLGFTSFFVKAAVGALRTFPQLNAEIQGDEIVLKHYYDIGIAVGAAEGLVVPVLRDADRLSFGAIEQAVKDFAQRSEAGTLTLEDLRGGTFTITNGGVFGSLMSTPILNPPQVGILGLHKIEPRPVVVNDEIVIRSMMYVALSYDHRVVDGREAVQFLVKVKSLIEDPEALMLEG